MQLHPGPLVSLGQCPRLQALASEPPPPLLWAATGPPPLPLATTLGAALSPLPTVLPVCLGCWVCTLGPAQLLDRLALVEGPLLLTLSSDALHLPQVLLTMPASKVGYLLLHTQQAA